MMGRRGPLPDQDAYFVMVYARAKRFRRMVLYRRLGPMPWALAIATTKEWSARSFDCQMIRDRTAYYAAYHKDRYANDPNYVERKRIHAREWQRARSKERQR